MSGSNELPYEKVKYIYVSRLCHLLIFIGGILGLLSHILIVYVSVVCHECAHLLMCKKLGVKTKRISFYPYGAHLEISSLVCPKKQLLISVSGPLCSLLLFALAKLIYLIFKNPYISYFSMINFTLFMFNMLPSIPLDGGEILRSVLSLRFGILNSFRIITYVSYFFETVFLFAGFFICINSGGNITLIVISAIILKSILKYKNTVIMTTGKILTEKIESDRKIKLIVKHKNENLYKVIKDISFGYTLIIAVYDGERYMGFVTQNHILNCVNFVQTFGECVEKSKEL